MPRVDKERFPKLIVQIPENQFPDKLSVIMVGNNYTTPNKTTQLALQTGDQALGSPFAQGGGLPDSQNIISEIDFESSQTIGGVKYSVAELETPFSNIKSVRGWAQRDDFENTEPIDVTMFTATPNKTSSTPGQPSSAGLEGVWAYQFTMRKQALNSEYIADYLLNGTGAGNAAQTASQIVPLVTQGAQIFAQQQLPALPTPRAIASKLLAAGAAPIQQSLALVGQQYAAIKPKVDQATAVAQAIRTIIEDPQSIVTYIPLIMGFIFELIPKEEIAKVIYDFEG